ncbi:MAG: hypothetical protein Q9159_006855, partial [Coniocarpon cinnabarinum]
PLATADEMSGNGGNDPGNNGPLHGVGAKVHRTVEEIHSRIDEELGKLERPWGHVQPKPIQNTRPPELTPQSATKDDKQPKKKPAKEDLSPLVLKELASADVAVKLLVPYYYEMMLGHENSESARAKHLDEVSTSQIASYTSSTEDPQEFHLEVIEFPAPR